MSAPAATAATAERPSVGSSLRLAVVGGLLSYRALFNWLRPSMYIPCMLGAPLFQLFFFAELGRYSGAGDSTFYVVGNGVQVCAMSGVFAMAFTVGNERFFGTLPYLLASRANRAALFLGRLWPVALNGLFVSVFVLACGAVFLDVHIATAQIPAILLVLVVSAGSCSAFGMLFGSIGLRVRDVLFGANLAYFSMLLLCGVEVPRSVLPPWLHGLGDALPLTRGITAARRLAAGDSLSSVAGLVGGEALIGAGYLLTAYVVIRVLERSGTRAGSLETI